MSAANDKGLNPSNDLWVAHKYGMTDIDKVFLNKEDAQVHADELNEKIKNIIFYNKNQKGYTVLSLDDAIWEITKDAKDDYQWDDENY
jgi:hypothetical protein